MVFVTLITTDCGLEYYVANSVSGFPHLWSTIVTNNITINFFYIRIIEKKLNYQKMSVII